MKKRFIFFLVFVLAIPFFGFAIAEPTAMRNGITFGMTIEEVIHAEGASPNGKSASALLYSNQKAAGKNCDIFYSFEDGMLHDVLIQIKENHTDSNLYIQDFKDVDKSLTAKYGNAKHKEIYDWSNKLYLSEEENHGKAIVSGHLTIRTFWSVDDGQICNILTGKDGVAEHSIMYLSNGSNTDGI